MPSSDPANVLDTTAAELAARVALAGGLAIWLAMRAGPFVLEWLIPYLEAAVQWLDSRYRIDFTLTYRNGHGKDGSEEENWKRSIENISLAVPTAAQYGVQIVIENVWNHFLYNHEGDHTQTAEKYVRYVDQLNSPWVGMQFDIGNHWKYGSMGGWIRQLGKRVMKLDIKGFSRAQNQFTRISEGDIDYADVRKALREIQFYGWAAAEVGGGDAAELKRISGEMDVAFGLV